MTQSYRTAFIRITAKNETNNDLPIEYTLNDIESNLTNWANSAGIIYWLIEHNAEDLISSHFHIVIKFKNPTKFEIIKNRFPFGNIENAKNLRNCIQYLIHLNNPEKEQYSWQDIKTNCPDMTQYKTEANLHLPLTLKTILKKIDQGEIREFNQYTEIPIEMWAKHKIILGNALIYHREQICMNKHRNINVTFISGATGICKTTFAKKYCDDTQKSYCNSSSSNDPLQDYKGEDVLILDDFRDSDFKFSDLLKVLDNHTKSSVRSRYNNKAFIGNEIIITSFVALDLLYPNLSDLARDQLYRRISVWYKFYTDHVDFYRLNEETLTYQLAGTAPNILKEKMKEMEQLKPDEQMLKATGFEVTEITSQMQAQQEVTEIAPALPPEVKEVKPASPTPPEAKPAGMSLSWLF